MSVRLEKLDDFTVNVLTYYQNDKESSMEQKFLNLMNAERKIKQENNAIEGGIKEEEEDPSSPDVIIIDQ